MLHTKGPWFTKQDQVYDESGNTLAFIMSTSAQLEYEEAAANGKLIAAAPELLNACHTILSNFQANKNFGTLPTEQELEAGINILKAAIDKATA